MIYGTQGADGVLNRRAMVFATLRCSDIGQRGHVVTFLQSTCSGFECDIDEFEPAFGLQIARDTSRLS